MAEPEDGAGCGEWGGKMHVFIMSHAKAGLGSGLGQ